MRYRHDTAILLCFSLLIISASGCDSIDILYVQGTLKLDDESPCTLCKIETINRPNPFEPAIPELLKINKEDDDERYLITDANGNFQFAASFMAPASLLSPFLPRNNIEFAILFPERPVDGYLFEYSPSFKSLKYKRIDSETKDISKKEYDKAQDQIIFRISTEYEDSYSKDIAYITFIIPRDTN